jgi:DNA-binding NarL/FixJ family response regulator
LDKLNSSNYERNEKGSIVTGARILIIDDHPPAREGLAIAARAALPGAVVDQVDSVGAACELAMRHGRYKLVLIDCSLPDAPGCSGLLTLQQKLPDAPIVGVASRSQLGLAGAMKMFGAAGFLSKTNSLDAIAGSLRQILAGSPAFPQDCRSERGLAAARARIKDLSSAQLRVLIALADGRLNKQIANDLKITEATVKAHLTAVFRKLGVRGRTQALLAVQPLLGNREAGDAMLAEA